MVELVLFDLGGVLADFGGVGPMRELAGIDSDEEIWKRWLSCPWVRAFERGTCGVEEFADGLVNEWKLPTTPRAFLDGFQSWLAGPFPGAEDLVRSVKDGLRVGCLSNTNEVHWNQAVKGWDLVELFDFCFLSFQIGLLKPDVEVFEYVARVTRIPPSRILFLDDNLINVDAARRVGLTAVQVRGIGEARSALETQGVL